VTSGTCFSVQNPLDFLKPGQTKQWKRLAVFIKRKWSATGRSILTLAIFILTIFVVFIRSFLFDRQNSLHFFW
jgi:hypothetical protein